MAIERVVRRRRRADGPRHRPGPRGDRQARSSLYEPDLARAEAGRDRIAGNLERAVAKGRLDAGGARRDPRPDRRPTDRPRRAPPTPTSSSRRSSRTSTVKTRLWARARRDRAGGRDLRLEHVVDRDRPRSPRRSREARAAAVRRHALLQPGAGDAADRAHPRHGDDRRDRGARSGRSPRELGKQVIVSADRPGFIVNRILMPFLAEAMRAFEEGLGTADDIDTGARVGLNHPMGPLELADFIGLDVCLGDHAGARTRASGSEHFAPPTVLEELVAAGHLGQKTGRGFHTYPGRARSRPGVHSGMEQPGTRPQRPRLHRQCRAHADRQVRRRARGRPGDGARRRRDPRGRRAVPACPRTPDRRGHDGPGPPGRRRPGAGAPGAARAGLAGHDLARRRSTASAARASRRSCSPPPRSGRATARSCVAGGMESMNSAPFLLREARFGYRLGDGTLDDATVHDGLWCAIEDCHMGTHAERVAIQDDVSPRGPGRVRAREPPAGDRRDRRRPVRRRDGAGHGPRREGPRDGGRRRRGPAARLDGRGARAARAGVRAARRARTAATPRSGTVTAGNAPGITDGAAATVVGQRARRRAATGSSRSPGSSATPRPRSRPKWLFLAPVDGRAPALETRTELPIEAFDLIEINEAFAAQTLADGRELGFDWSKVNVNGGAIALGHPIGASGARIVATLLHELARRERPLRARDPVPRRRRLRRDGVRAGLRFRWPIARIRRPRGARHRSRTDLVRRVASRLSPRCSSRRDAQTDIYLIDGAPARSDLSDAVAVARPDRPCARRRRSHGAMTELRSRGVVFEDYDLENGPRRRGRCRRRHRRSGRLVHR